MALSRGDWINIALCAAIIAMLTLAYNIGYSAPPRHTQDSPHPRSIEPDIATMVAELNQNETIVIVMEQTATINRPEESTATTTTTIGASDATPTMSINRLVAKEARNRPRVVEVCREGKCERRWAVTA